MAAAKITKYEKELVTRASSDLKAAQLLLAEKLYPEAIFHFQQSVEKASKFLALISKLTTPEELENKIRHNISIIYKRNLQVQIDNINKTAAFVKQKPELKTIWPFNFDYKEYLEQSKASLKFVSDLEKDWSSLIRIKEKDILDIISLTKELMREKLMENLSKKDIDEFIDNMGQLTVINPDIMSGILDELENAGKDKLLKVFVRVRRVLNIVISAAGTLFCFGMLTLPYAVWPRYPVSTNKRYPSEVYTRTLPFVRYLPVMLGIQKKVLRKLVNLEKELEIKK